MENNMAQIQVVGTYIVMVMNAYMYVCSGQRESFNHKIHVNEDSVGQLKLDSSGHFANIIHLDRVEGIKRLLCRHDKILIAFKEFETVPNWLPGQVILGSSKWTCSLPNDEDGQSNGIYGKIRDVFRPKDGRLDLVIGPLGPLDLLEEATIHFHYNPFASEGIKGANTRLASDHSPNRRVKPIVMDEHKTNRTKRRISNMLTDILNQIDWHKNVSMFVPFNYDPHRHKQHFQFSLKRKHGSGEMHVSAGPVGIEDLLKVPEYFSLDCISCFSVASIEYTLDLKIEKIDNKPVVKQYISQVEAHIEMNTDFALRFREEMSINASKLFWRTQPRELLRIPIAIVPGLPPVELLIRYDFDVYVDLHARVNGPAMLRNKYVTAGSYVMSQSLASKAQIHGDVSVYNWTIKPLDGRSMLPSLADVKTSFKHRMGFNASLVWSGKDASIMMSPQTDITVEPVVSNYVHSDYFKKCLHSNVTVDGYFNIGRAYFDVLAFGKEIWNTYLANGYKKSFTMVSKELHNECRARCTGPVVTGYPNEIEAVLGQSIARLTQNRSMIPIYFRDLRGDTKLFSIGEDGYSSCNNASEGLTKGCSTRLVTKTMAMKLARLYMSTKTEWSNRYMVAAEGLDESPDFKYKMSSAFKDGRAMTFGLTDETFSANASSSLSNNTNKIKRLGQLAVCAGFDYVAITNISGQVVVIVGVNNVTEEPVVPSIPGAFDERTIFDTAIQYAGSDVAGCSSKVHFKTGDSYPSGQTAESWCGPSTGRTHFLAPSASVSLYEYPYNDIKFKAEGSPEDWCGSEMRRCNSCNQSSITGPMVSWESCITRIMTPRLALHLRKLANIAKRDSLDLQVEKAFAVDSSDTSFNDLDALFFEGRAARITLVSRSQSKMNLLMNAAICAEFDFVRYTSPQFVDVFVRRQDGYIERKSFFPSGRGFVSVRAQENLTSEYGYPLLLNTEAQNPALIDGHDDTIHVSKYYTISDFKDSDNRDFRLDPGLVECLQEASEELGRKVDILPGSAYKTRSANLINYDILHLQEMLRHQAGQAARVNLGKSSKTNDLVKLGKSLMRQCIPLLLQQQRSIGIGCYIDSLYIDVRPIFAGEETAPMHVWNSGGDDVYKELQEAADKVNNGGPLISPIDYTTACSSATMVSSDKQYLSFQLGYPPQCSRAGSGVSDFCQKTKQYLREQGSSLQKRLTSAAGSDRLPRQDIINEINACVVDACGGCPATGSIWDRKVRSCSKMIGKYLSRASCPFRELANRTAFFNPDNDQSTVHSLACHDGNICVENVQLYSLLMPLITAKYTVKAGNSVEEMLFNNEDNPSPLLELVAQELAMHTSGVVKVYIDSLGDISRIRNVLKVAMVYNKNISHVEFHISGSVNRDSVMATIQRKVEIWSGTACSDVSRLTIAPFSVHNIHEHRLKRSIERGKARNQEKLRIKNWEVEWVSKL